MKNQCHQNLASGKTLTALQLSPILKRMRSSSLLLIPLLHKMVISSSRVKVEYFFNLQVPRCVILLLNIPDMREFLIHTLYRHLLQKSRKYWCHLTQVGTLPLMLQFNTMIFFLSNIQFFTCLVFNFAEQKPLWMQQFVSICN